MEYFQSMKLWCGQNKYALFISVPCTNTVHCVHWRALPCVFVLTPLECELLEANIYDSFFLSALMCFTHRLSQHALAGLQKRH